MIRRVRLEYWRSYESLDLELKPGTTFVVAPNGVGKTSLMLALAWAIFGDHSATDAKSCIRVGADEARVEVELVLPDGRCLTIERRVRRRGRGEVRGNVDGQNLDDAEVASTLKQAFGVELSVAARLALMLGGGQRALSDELDLESHLHHVFGVTNLIATTVLARKAAKDAERKRVAVRALAKERMADREKTEQELATLKEELDQQRARARELEPELQHIERQRRIAHDHATYVSRREEFDSEIQAVLQRAGELIEQPATLTQDDALQRLHEARDEAERLVRDQSELRATAEGTIAASKESLELLSGATARCPACLQEIDEEQLVSACAKHQQRIRSATDSAQQHSAVEALLHAKISSLVKVIARFQAIRPPPPPSTSLSALEREANLEATHAEKVEAQKRIHHEIGGLETRIRRLSADLRSDDEVAESQRELYLAYRREGLALAAAEAFERLSRQVSEQLIEPVANEVRRRWRRLFSGDGLTLRPDGKIVRLVGGEELAWDTLSGGERIWAHIITHLLVVTSFTRLPFVWFDEPLEHLDPVLRRSVAAMLANATTQGRPKQLLVTTYENALVAQLASDTETASVVNVRSAIDGGDGLLPGDGSTNRLKTRRAS